PRIVLTVGSSPSQTGLLRSNFPMKTLHPRSKRIGGLLAAACLALAPVALAVDPPPDGGYPGGNTAEGEDALFSLGIGLNNTAVGFQTLFNNTKGNDNTSVGY